MFNKSIQRGQPFVENSDCGTGIEIIIHRFEKPLLRLIEIRKKRVRFFRNGTCVVFGWQFYRVERLSCNSAETVKKSVKMLGSFFGLLNQKIIEFNGPSVMCRKQKETYYFWSVTIQQIRDGNEISLGFGHLVAGHLHESVVHPVFGNGFSCEAFGLGDFVFVVGKNEVQTTSVNVKGFPEMFHTHCRAFNVPSRASRAPRAVPGWFFWFS